MRKRNCPYSAIGHATDEKRFILRDENNLYIDLPMEMLFGEKGEQKIEVNSSNISENSFDYSDYSFEDCLLKVLSLPAVASKQFFNNNRR